MRSYEANNTETAIARFCEVTWGDKDNQIPEGRASFSDLEAEIGDVLVVLSQLAARCGTSLEELRARRFAYIQSRAKK